VKGLDGEDGYKRGYLSIPLGAHLSGCPYPGNPVQIEALTELLVTYRGACTFCLAAGAELSVAASVTYDFRSGAHSRRWTAGTAVGELWHARLVATTAEDRLNIRRNSHRVCGGQRMPNTIAITPLGLR
jgi:hypothetical protein